jgi:hypothetical protein
MMNSIDPQNSKIASFQLVKRGNYLLKVSVLQDGRTKARSLMVVAQATANLNPFFITRFFVDMGEAADFIDWLATLE